MGEIANFIQSHRLYFDAAQGISSIINIVGWCLGTLFLFVAWRRKRIHSVVVGPIRVMMQEAAVEATATAARNWQAHTSSEKVDISRIRDTIGKAFAPQIADNLTGKSILWVDDNPVNNELAVRALRKLSLDVEQATTTQMGLDAMARRYFDLVISDMGRGSDLRAGYELLDAIRTQHNAVPFLIFAGSDNAEFRREAAQRGAQLSTNDMLELIDAVIRLLGK